MFVRRPGLTWLLENILEPNSACILWPFTTGSSGYGQFSAYGKPRRAHSYVCELTHGPKPSPRHQAAHECGNTKCVNPRHIFWKTPAENQIDRHKHGTATTAGQRWRLTPKQVADIRDSQIGAVASARFYGVSEANIRQIRTGKIWRTGKREAGGFFKSAHSSAKGDE